MVYMNDNYYGRFHQGDGAPRGVDQGTTKIIEENEHEIPNIQAFTPMLSNVEEVKDVPLLETFVNTLEEGTNTSPHTPKSVYCKLRKVSGKIATCKQALIGNANYLAKAMNKFVEGSINVERYKLEYNERMIALLI
jgi:hypothetical protein